MAVAVEGVELAVHRVLDVVGEEFDGVQCDHGRLWGVAGERQHSVRHHPLPCVVQDGPVGPDDAGPVRVGAQAGKVLGEAVVRGKPPGEGGDAPPRLDGELASCGRGTACLPIGEEGRLCHVHQVNATRGTPRTTSERVGTALQPEHVAKPRPWARVQPDLLHLADPAKRTCPGGHPPGTGCRRENLTWSSSNSPRLWQ